MQFKFVKSNNNQDIDISIVKDGKEEPFSYIQMIKYLINGDCIDNQVNCECFTKEEKDSVSAMIIKLNEIVNKNPDELSDNVATLTENAENPEDSPPF
jgi:hypothetical protein